eukprot:TRINITY_DN43527_c0_g1_i1.p1 TRINITY_DN43527_c0_g1~~TRINITY_DN43527_c0_g1_i1.p1  ORF type:complete len:410 (+),score=129.82 TRINITY_DN43527_c0_g1_i1:190-1419(+)
MDEDFLFEQYAEDSEEDTAAPAPPAQPKRRCEYCKNDIPAEVFDAHTGPCRGRKYLGKVGHLLNEEGCLEALTKIARGTLRQEAAAGNLQAGQPTPLEAHLRDSSQVDVPFVFDIGTAGILPGIEERFEQGAASASGSPLITPAVYQDMKERALSSGCRTEDRFDKHFDQEVSLCGHIAEMVKSQHPEIFRRAAETGDATADICIIDCGAAAGELLHIFQSVFKTSIVLVEFYEPPRMIDALYEGNSDFCRLWKKVEEVTEQDLAPMRRTVNIVVAKHLCGDGTDAAMRCIVDGWRTFFPVTHFVTAPCCQQMSTWGGYSGREFLANDYNLTESDFNVIRTKTGWKSLHHRDCRTRHRHLYDIAKIYEAAWHYGRVAYLRGVGARVDVFQFVPEDVTIKNVCITAQFPA